ncbi:MAG: hypothetical protein ACSHYA_10480 [Opitutaceae bacterium]
MKTFEEFVDYRERTDPAAQRMTEHQWKQAYEAYCSSRERLRKTLKSKDSGTSSKRSSSKKSGGKSEHSGSSSLLNPNLDPKSLKLQVRQNSAYRGLRTIVDILSWIVIVIFAANAILKMTQSVDTYDNVSFILDGILGVLITAVLKQLLQVIIDIPDIALFKVGIEKSTSRGTRE